MNTKTIMICSLGLALALSSCATKHAQPNGAAAQGNAPAVRTCQAPASIVGKTLHIDASRASYKIELSVPPEERVSYRRSAHEYVEETNSFDYCFQAGGKLKMKRFPGERYLSYAYRAEGANATISLQIIDALDKVSLTFLTPTTGIAQVVQGGPIGTEYGNVITFSNMPFTLK